MRIALPTRQVRLVYDNIYVTNKNKYYVIYFKIPNCLFNLLCMCNCISQSNLIHTRYDPDQII